MYTHFYLYFDSNNRIIHRTSVQVDTLLDGCHLQSKQSLEMQMQLQHAVKAKAVTIQTSLLNKNPNLHFDAADYCLACSELNLTMAETDVMLQLREHKTNKEIAAALFISEKTVEAHLKAITGKLNVNGRAKLVRKIEDKARGYR